MNSQLGVASVSFITYEVYNVFKIGIGPRVVELPR